MNSTKKWFMAPMLALALLLTTAVSVVVPQNAQAAALGNATENSLLDAFLRGQSYTMPATVYIALETSAGSDTGCGTEVSGGSYARVAVTSSMANWANTQASGTATASSGTNGTTSNSNPITFAAPSANWGTVVGFCAMTASTSGTMLFRANLTTSKNVNSGDAAPSFAAGALTFQLDN